MPELPEVEVSRLGVEPNLVGRCIIEAVLRTPRLRHALTPELAASLVGKRIDAVRRRGKYLLFDCESSHGGGWLILHLGMSGSLRLVPPGTPAQKHDHVDLVFAHTVLRLRDPRRFGTLVWHPGTDVEAHPLLAVQGIEPLSDAFDGDWLYAATRGRRTPIKPFLMDSHRIVGVGNIYAAESLFRAGIAPPAPPGGSGASAAIDLPPRCARRSRKPSPPAAARCATTCTATAAPEASSSTARCMAAPDKPAPSAAIPLPCCARPAGPVSIARTASADAIRLVLE